jgi:Chitobiase/beta-hexosaminidase C-terminal domain
MRRFLIAIVALLAWALPASATTRYIAQTAGTFSGGSACNGQTAITLATFAGVTLSPGDTTFICGTITASAGVTGSAITIGQNGTSGNPITILFDTGAILQAGAWNAGAIFIGGRNWIVINGGTNGIIQATQNGTILTNQTDNGSCIDSGNSSSVSNVTVENLSCQNIYVRTSTTDVITSNNFCIKLAGGTNITVTENTCNNMHWAIYMTYGLGSTLSTGFIVSNNTISNMDHGVILADPNIGASTLTGSNCSTAVHDNAFSAMNTWDDTTGGNNYHHDATHFWANASGAGARYSGVCLYNNKFQGNPGAEVSGIFSLESLGSANFIFDNIVDITSTTGTCGDGAITHFTGTGSTGNGNFYLNNLVVVPSGTACGIDYQFTQTANETLENNIGGENNASGNGTYVSLGSPLSGSFTLADFNSYQLPAGGNPFNGPTGCASGASFASWRGTCGFDTHGQNATFTLNSDFTIPSGSVLIGSAANLTSLGITALDTGAPQTFGAGGSCGTGCLARPSTGAWDPGAFPFQAGTIVATPVISPTSGAVPQTVTITDSTSGAVICYTTNGATPTAATAGTCDQNTYSGPLSITVASTVRTIGTLVGATNSSIASATFTSGTGATVSGMSGGAKFSGGARKTN